ncbi:hypothetical protein FRB99_003356 [Tulasnella sp. 403]|nr:hypothetical protein FRB99_003356 [Tulasnella sp. 403]
MHALLAGIALSLAVKAAPAPTVGPICLSPIFTGTPPYIQASTPGTAVTGFNLTEDGTAALVKQAPLGRIIFENGAIGVYEDSCFPSYLNIGTSDKSYKPLSWTGNLIENVWNADFDQVVAANASSSFQASTTFIACKPISVTGYVVSSWTVYLQTGADKPDNAHCVNTELKVSSNTLEPVGK